MKRALVLTVALLMIFGVAAVAGVSDTGAYLGIAQTFAGNTDSYIGYTFGDALQTSAFSVQFNVDNLFGVGASTPAFLLESTYGFGLLYEYDVDALDLEIYADTWLKAAMNNFARWDAGARAEFLVLPNPCKEVGPCYNPELKVFAEIGITQDFEASGSTARLPVVWGEVGFEVHL